MSKPSMWCAFFSMTGTEICDLSDHVGYAPDVIVTNAPEDKINPRIYSLGVEIRRVPWRPTVEHYFAAIPRDLHTVVTLHGWLKIIPPEVCEAFYILNGHPALIDQYPELKGKDKQEVVANNAKAYPWIGSVIHKVVPELDAGEILFSCRRPNTAKTIDEAYSLLRGPSLQTWIRFMNTYHPIDARVQFSIYRAWEYKEDKALSSREA